MQVKHRTTVVLSVLAVILVAIYIGSDFWQVKPYVQTLRLNKLWGYLLVVVAIVPSTIVFQTLVQSRYLSPGILGMDAVYVVVQTLYYFFYDWIGQTLVLHSVVGFLIQLAFMLVGYLGLIVWLKPSWRAKWSSLWLLMSGMVLSTVLRSMSTFLQVLMDPNEYDRLQSKLFPNFQAIPSSLLGIGTLIIVSGCVYYWVNRRQLDVLHLGRDTAESLGVPVQQLTTSSMFVIVALISTSTALAGPLTFLGFMVANITYYLIQCHEHGWRIVGGILLGGVLILAGQLFVERVVNYQYNLSMLIEGVGGALFFALLLIKERA